MYLYNVQYVFVQDKVGGCLIRNNNNNTVKWRILNEIMSKKKKFKNYKLIIM